LRLWSLAPNLAPGNWLAALTFEQSILLAALLKHGRGFADRSPEQHAHEVQPAIIASIGEEGVIALSALSIRNLDDGVKERLRVRAARHGRSMEAEVRAILTDAVAEPGESPDLFHALMERFGELGGVELDLPPRATRPRAAEFGS